MIIFRKKSFSTGEIRMNGLPTRGRPLYLDDTTSSREIRFRKPPEEKKRITPPEETGETEDDA